MKICNVDKLHEMVDEFCVDKRPKSIDIHKMIRECTEYDSILIPAEYKPNYTNDSEVASRIKLNMAVAVFETLLEELEDISVNPYTSIKCSMNCLIEISSKRPRLPGGFAK